MTFRIVSYNLLVPVYANRPEHYYKCQIEYLQTDHRWNLIQIQLEQEIINNENTIICLQEVSLELLPRLALFFRRLNYSFFHNLYGRKKNDYMGIGIGIPISMQLNSMSVIKIGDYIHSISKLRENQTSYLKWALNLGQSILSKFIQPEIDPWKSAMEKPNTLIYLQVIIEGKSLCIGTYHMPCLYKQPEVMAIHSSVVKDLMFDLSAGQDFILAGDFNIKPGDVCYQALIERCYPNINLPKSNTFEIAYVRQPEQILKSAYREKNGSEPVYTNYSDTSPSPKFSATLDYIFFSGRLKVENVLELPNHPTGPSYPDETHPSDHLMIGATFRL